jgi:transcriptional regulator with XRE-family HTH domain
LLEYLSIMLDSPSSTESAQSDVNARIAARVAALRAERKLTLDALAAKCNVSRSMISLIERGESSPTAVVLEKLAAGLGVTLAALFQDPGDEPRPLHKRADQAQWRDPASGYLRRNVSPPSFPSPMQLVEVFFPAGARVAYETGARDANVHQQIWVIEGAIDVSFGKAFHRVEQGDCLAMRLDQPMIFHNPHRKPARYLVAIVSA